MTKAISPEWLAFEKGHPFLHKSDQRLACHPLHYVQRGAPTGMPNISRSTHGPNRSWPAPFSHRPRGFKVKGNKEWDKKRPTARWVADMPLPAESLAEESRPRRASMLGQASVLQDPAPAPVVPATGPVVRSFSPGCGRLPKPAGASRPVGEVVVQDAGHLQQVASSEFLRVLEHEEEVQVPHQDADQLVQAA